MHALCKLLFLALALTQLAIAGQPPKYPSAHINPVDLDLPLLTGSSGYIFAGTVQSVAHSPSTTTHPVASTQITFQVEQAIRGVRNGQQLVIREWGGLWNSGERYRVGEHVLLFLYPPSKLGFTSPVGGAMGRFPMNEGHVVLEPARGTLLPKTPTEIRNSGRTLVNWDDFIHLLGRVEE